MTARTRQNGEDDALRGPRRRLHESLSDCAKCGLCEGRTQVVFGVGEPERGADVRGRGPGLSRGQAGRAFRGAAGKLLTELLAGIGLSRPTSTSPTWSSADRRRTATPLPTRSRPAARISCSRSAIIRPRVICTLGRFATKLLADTELSITAIHGKAKEAELARSARAALPGLPSGGRSLHAGEPQGAGGGLRASCALLLEQGLEALSPADRGRRRPPAAERASASAVQRRRQASDAGRAPRPTRARSSCLCGRHGHVVFSERRGRPGAGSTSVGRRLARASAARRPRALVRATRAPARPPSCGRWREASE